MRKRWAWSDGLYTAEQLALEIAANMSISEGQITPDALKYLDSIDNERLHTFLADNAFIINRKGTDTDMMRQVVMAVFDGIPGIKEATDIVDEKEYEAILPYLERIEESTGWENLTKAFFDLCLGVDVFLCPSMRDRGVTEAKNQGEEWLCGYDALRRAALAAQIEISKRNKYKTDGYLTDSLQDYLQSEISRAAASTIWGGMIMPDTVKKPVLDEDEKILIGQKFGAIMRHMQSAGEAEITVTVFEKQAKGSVKGIISTISGCVDRIDIAQSRIVVDGQRIRLGDIIALEIPPEMEDEEYTENDSDWDGPLFGDVPDSWNTDDWSEGFYEAADDFTDSQRSRATSHQKKNIRKPY